MQSDLLTARLEEDFVLALRGDNWRNLTASEFIAPQYLQRYMGLVTDNAAEIDYVYTAVFPSPAVIEKILADGRRGALLFVHHPMQWDMTKIPVFSDVPLETLRALREREISIYNLHAPLDANGPYGTTWNLAKALGVAPTEEFYDYHGVKVGVIGQTECRTMAQLQRRFEEAVGHEVKLYAYGGDVIINQTVALVAGGGNDAEIYRQLRKRGVNAYVSGITNMRTGYAPAIKAHRAAKRGGVSILAGTHYSTEKFACMKMLDYFARLGLPGEFVPDAPCMDDM